MSNPRPFSSAMMPMGDDEHPRQLNGGHDDTQSRRGPPKPKNKNVRGKQHKQNGKSKEQTPTSPTPDEKENQALGQVVNTEVGIHSPIPTIDSSAEQRTGNWDTTTDENFVTANNSAEESQNGNGDVFISPVSKQLEEDVQNSNTSTSGGTLTPNNSILQGSPSNDSKILNAEEDLHNSMDVEDDEGSLANASLAVQLSDTVGDAMNFLSFQAPSLDSSMSTSPLSSSRSAPPHLPTIQDEDSPQNRTDSILYSDTNQFQTSTPICSSNVASRRGRAGEGDGNVTTGEAPAEPWDSTIYQEDPTTILRANRGFRVDYDDSANQNSNEIGFMSTKESGICDMSQPSSDYKEKECDETKGAAILGAVNELIPTSPTNDSNVEVPFVSAHETPKEAGVPKPAPTPPKSGTSQSTPHKFPQRNDSGSEVDEEVEEINKPFLLPSTVTELTAANGVKVYVVGTAHFSRQSQLDVVETIGKVRPDIVVLELCRSRSGMLNMTEEQIMKEAEDMSLAKFRATIRQSGAVQGLLHLLLLQMTASLTKKLGMAPGGEFRVAVQEAQKIPGCIVHLGDRELSITLNRALSGLNIFQKVKLAWHFLRANDTDITKEDVEACKEKDLLEKLLEEMAGEFPSITQVLLSERDLYLANSLWQAAMAVRMDRSGNIQNRRPIVGVVGLGHVGGIVKNWGEIPEETMAELIDIRESPLSHVIIGKVVKFSFYGLLGYLTYKSSRKLFNFPSDALITSVIEKTSSTFQKLSPKGKGMGF